MDRDILVKRVLKKIQRLPESEVKEVNDFVEYLLNKIDDQMITEGIQNIISNSKSFDFLKSELDLYSINDLKVKYK